MEIVKNNIAELLFKNNIQYIIPVYQRNYDWQKEHCEELFDDVFETEEKNKQHFLGSIVLVEDEKINNLRVFSIVDGQQRLTTIYLLLKALYDTLDNGNDFESKNQMQQIEELLFNFSTFDEIHLQNKLKLKPISSDNKQLIYLMTNKLSERDLDSNIWKNYNHFMYLFKKKLEFYSYSELATIIFNSIKKLTIVFIMLDNKNDDPQEIFERINSTGKELMLSDLIRNSLLLGADEANEKAYNDYWVPMEELLKKDELFDEYIKSFLYFAGTLKHEEKRKGKNKKNWYKIFKRYLENKTKLDVLQDLYKFSQYFYAIKKRHDIFSPVVNNLLNKINVFAPDDSYPLFYWILDDYKNKIIDEKVLVNTLKFFINYFVRQSIAKVNATYNEIFIQFHEKAFKNKIKNNENYLLSLMEFVKTLHSYPTYKMPTPQDVHNALIDKQLLGLKNKDYLGYTILNIAEKGFANWAEDSTRLSIKNKAYKKLIYPILATNWKDALGLEYTYLNENYFGLIGNWAMLRSQPTKNEKNDSISNLLKDKILLLDNFEYSKTNSTILNAINWKESEIKERTELLADFFKLEIKHDFDELVNLIPKIQNINDNEFKIIDNTMYTTLSVDNIYDTNDKIPIQYSLFGEEKQINHWMEILTNIIKKLYEFVNQAIFSFGLPFISNERGLENDGRVIGDVYINTQISTNEILDNIKILIQKVPIFTNGNLIITFKLNNK
ncbi:DUF262 domain-containing protein [Mesomycoplasma neurolyticum]|uniref:Uncharacterized conserved protein n=1 Tax=Mesomycoplasma neurolyticum TaxID=2120 RepID=A0A449A6A4_9BACT|nr:DUF262 domain-containing protein [Mesomycoplasma neurolyticum]VEU59766.1 Uncharacterized conserved protein [Mesomycoplasma neurolyticum]VEU59905.1 Uncharacterized conserved protein [Mesomycoplasma neurolyticum]